MMAANNGHVNCILVLNASGAGISKQDRYGVTGALVSASSKECLDCVKELLEAGSGSNMIDLTDQKGNTALLYTTRSGQKECVKQLLMAGADSNVVDNSDESAVVLAINKGSMDLVEMLISAGADVNTNH